jgi:hypothetical protein
LLDLLVLVLRCLFRLSDLNLKNISGILDLFKALLEHEVGLRSIVTLDLHFVIQLLFVKCKLLESFISRPANLIFFHKNVMISLQQSHHLVLLYGGHSIFVNQLSILAGVNLLLKLVHLLREV